MTPRSLPARVRVVIWALMGAVVAGPLGLWITDPVEPIMVQRASVVTVGAALPRAMIRATYEAIVTRPVTPGWSGCLVRTNGQSVDALGFARPLATTTLNYDPGQNVIGVTNVVPMDAPPGMLRIEGELVWSCNPLQRLLVAIGRPKVTKLPVLTVNVLAPL